MRVLIDSDFLFGLFVASDVHHHRAKQLFSQCKDRQDELYVLQLVLFETATVLSYKIGQQSSLSFLETVTLLELTTISLETSLERLGWQVFKEQTKNGTSFIDCANIAALRYYKFDGILSFDVFYPKGLRVTN